MIIENPKDVHAQYAGRLARQYRAVWEAWQANRLPELATVMADLMRQREDHQARTGWVAEYGGHTTTYHYTNPAERPQL